jgi:acetyl-CoA carboxylase biotin carboxyl carrier protein
VQHVGAPMAAAPAVTVMPAAPSPVAHHVEAPRPRPSAPPRAAAAEAPADKKGGHVITSPFVGTFYRSPAPDQPPFVEVGTSVKKGGVLCIIEAMKLMNEIEAEVAGKVAEVLVQNGQPVEFGQPLFRIEPA